MSRKRYKAEQIITCLHEAEVLLGKGQTTQRACTMVPPPWVASRPHGPETTARTRRP
jgi:hypothetical protein